ncbi:unnamed protein product [Rhizophagus irregularis]|nr:unnamed protein product [Rhizophagus irregularis]
MSAQDFTFSNPSPNASPITIPKKKEKMLVGVLSPWYGRMGDLLELEDDLPTNYYINEEEIVIGEKEELDLDKV